MRRYDEEIDAANDDELTTQDKIGLVLCIVIMVLSFVLMSLWAGPEIPGF